MPKLVAIGDSLTQGVQSGAVSDPEFSYPALIAQAMGLDVTDDFRAPKFPGHGLPLNIEWLLDSMSTELGVSIESREWFRKVPSSLRDHLSRIEEYYERGDGARPARDDGVYHNLAVSGFRVYDSFMVNSKYCHCQIHKGDGWFKDDFYGLPSASIYRIAQRVLNPKLNPDRKHWTQIDNLRYFTENGDPVENLILFLGANDCLGTVRDLKIKRMPATKVDKDPEKRRDRYNLTSLSAFKKDYGHMVDLISESICPETKVFVGTIPYVTIPPITRGLGDRDGQYFERYGPFFAPEDYRPLFGRTLSRDKVEEIDQQIDKFNNFIKEEVEERENWHIVDICELLNSLAIRRRQTLDGDGESDAATSVLTEFFKKRKVSDHPLLRPNFLPPSVLRLESERRTDEDNVHNGSTREDSHGVRTGGGFFSLDCFHPTTIGYGLIAEAFLDKMKKEDVEMHDNDRSPWQQLEWETLIEQDSLINDPPIIWDDVIDAAIAYPRLASIFYRILL